MGERHEDNRVRTTVRGQHNLSVRDTIRYLKFAKLMCGGCPTFKK